jgi:hypothetical protein
MFKVDSFLVFDLDVVIFVKYVKDKALTHVPHLMNMHWLMSVVAMVITTDSEMNHHQHPVNLVDYSRKSFPSILKNAFAPKLDAMNLTFDYPVVLLQLTVWHLHLLFLQLGSEVYY